MERLLESADTSEDRDFLLHLGCVTMLLHDLGHGPFSHVAEKAFGIDHEKITSQLLDCNEIASILERHGLPISRIKNLLLGPVPPQDKLLAQFVSSQLDCDRLDYLIRDAYFTGVGFANIDLPRIIRMLQVHTGNGPFKGLAISLTKGRYTLESYILTRYLMYQAVYYHKATRGAELLVRKAIERATEIATSNPLPDRLSFLQEGRKPNADEILALDDHELFSILSGWRKSSDEILSNMADRFINRKLLKTIEMSHPMLSAWVSGIDNKAEELAERKGFDPKYYCRIDSQSETPYKPYSPGEEESVMTSIFLYNEESNIKEISADSDVIHSLTKTRYNERLYVPDELFTEVKSMFASSSLKGMV